MAAVRNTWSDHRLDDLNAKVDDGFRRMDERFAQMDSRFDASQRETNARFDAIGFRFDEMHRLMIRFGAGMLGVIVAAMVSLVATHL